MTWRGRIAVYLSSACLLWQLVRVWVLHQPLGWLGVASVTSAVVVLVMAERYVDAEGEDQS